MSIFGVPIAYLVFMFLWGACGFMIAVKIFY